MTRGRRWLKAAMVLTGAAVSLAALSGCNGSEAQGPTTFEPTTAPPPDESTGPDTPDTTTTDPATTDPATTDPATTVPPTSTTTTPPSTSAPTTVVPPFDAEAADSTREVLALPGVAAWVDGVVGVASGDDASCDRIEADAPVLGAEVATQVIAITEPTLQEMLLNFDAAAESAVALCRQGSATAAAGEWAAAVALAAFIEERIALL